MKNCLYKSFQKYFKTGVALSSFFLMTNEEFASYMKGIESYLLNVCKLKSITKLPDIEKIKKDTMEVLNYAKTQFNVIVPENDCKMQYVYKSEDLIDFSWPDRYVKFAKENNQKLRWHTLVWHSQVAEWIFYDENKKYVSKELLDKRLKFYIDSLGKRYKNDIYSIDVINECISDKTFTLRNGKEKSLWYEILGETYIEKAFLYAKEAFPNSELVINDYNLESVEQKRYGLFNLVKKLLNKGVPIDAVGLQMHINLQTPSVQEIRETIEMFGSLGIKVIITEMDISIYNDIPDEERFENQKIITSEILDLQAERYFNVFECFKNYGKTGILSDVVLWGITDRFSWRNDFPVPKRIDAPLLFDRKGNPKPAYYKLIR